MGVLIHKKKTTAEDNEIKEGTMNVQKKNILLLIYLSIFSLDSLRGGETREESVNKKTKQKVKR